MSTSILFAVTVYTVEVLDYIYIYVNIVLEVWKKLYAYTTNLQLTTHKFSPTF